MKKYSFGYQTIIMGLIILSGATSCKRLVEIPGNPPTEITEAQQFADSATAMAAVAGVYSYPNNGGGSFTFNDGYLSLCTGISSDELTTTNTDLNVLQLYNYSETPFNDYVNSMWADPYTGIYPINDILLQVTLSPALSASFKKEIVAEMKVVRALYYFYLVNVFGDVPLIRGVDYKVNSNMPRTPADSVYAQIMKDLTEAQQDLPVDYPSGARYRPNQLVVSAFLAKVHLYRQEWQAAYDAANAVIGSGVYSLETNLNNVFLDGNNEAIWQLPGMGTYQGTKEAQQFVPYAPGVAPPYPLSAYLVNAFESGDQRLQDWAAAVVVPGNPTIYYPYKYKSRNFDGSTTEDFTIFRLGEQYLIRAEAETHLGHGADALADVNMVRARAGLGASTADPSDQAAVLNAIMHERQVELFCEWGNRWFDLKRTGTATAVLGSEKTGWQPNAALYPVPGPQIQLNHFLKQNPGYN